MKLKFEDLIIWKFEYGFKVNSQIDYYSVVINAIFVEDINHVVVKVL